LSYNSKGGHGYGNQKKRSGFGASTYKGHKIDFEKRGGKVWAKAPDITQQFLGYGETKGEALKDAQSSIDDLPANTTVTSQKEGKSGKMKGKDLSKVFKYGDFIMSKYRWPNEPTYDHLYKVVGFGESYQKGQGIDARLVAVKEDGKWIKRGDPGDHFNWGDSWKWDFTFDIGPKTPKKGHGKTFEYTGKLPKGID
jgi:hypothetical protein